MTASMFLYLYSFLFHLMIFFSFFYFTESKKTKYIYEKIININLQSQTINDKVIVENKEVSINESYKKKVLSKASKKIVEKKVTEVKKKVINSNTSQVV